MVRPEDVLAVVVASTAATAAEGVIETLLPDVRWVWIALVCMLLAGFGGLAGYLQSIKIGTATVRPRWSCIVPLFAHVVPASVGGLLVATAAFGMDGGVRVSPWTFFAAGMVGWRTRWAIGLASGVLERWVRGAQTRERE